MDNQKSTDQTAEDFSKSLDQLKEKSKEVKAKIEQEKRRHDLPLDSNWATPLGRKRPLTGISTYRNRLTIESAGAPCRR